MTRPGMIQRQFALNQRCRPPAQTPEGFANSAHTDPKLPRNLIVRTALGLEVLDPVSARGPQAGTPLRITSGPAQCRQPALLEALLAAPHGAGRVTKGPGHVVLIRPAYVDQAYHRMGLRHAVAYRILRQRHARHQHDAVPILGQEHAPGVDDARARWVSRVWKKIVAERVGHTGDATPPAKKADSFGSPPLDTNVQEQYAQKYRKTYEAMSGVLESVTRLGSDRLE